jgi:hypothetical protein
MELMRWLPALLFSIAASAQPAPFTLDQALGAAFPTELTAAPSGGKVAWVSNARGVRNIMLAEPPAYQARKITNYAQDDGQELQDLRWTPDASAIVYVRGGTANPDLDPSGASEARRPHCFLARRASLVGFARWQGSRVAGVRRARRVRATGVVAGWRAHRIYHRSRRP